MDRKHVPIVVLTGGPCAGKTSSVSYVSKRLAELGIGVAIVPELATTLMSGMATMRRHSNAPPGGIPLLECEINGAVAVQSMKPGSSQESAVKAQMYNEDLFRDMASFSETQFVVLCDRGVLDARAYMSDETFEEVLVKNNWAIADLRERRYDAIIHLTTAAIGAERFYSLENNHTRTETVAEASDLDGKCARAYLGHPRHYVVDNSTNFEAKKSRVLNIILELMHLPPIEFSQERRFLVEDFDLHETWENSFVEFDVYHLFLNEDQTMGQGRLTQRTEGGITTFFCSFRKPQQHNRHFAINERRIDEREYAAVATNANPDRTVVHKTIRSFLYNNNLIVVNVYREPKQFAIIEVRTKESDVAKFLPARFRVIKEVTDDAAYTSLAISAKS